MANTVRIKRRASGSPGAPTSLENAELAFNEVDDVLYYGKGTGGAGGSATAIEAIGGKGAFVARSGDQTVGGEKTFSVSPKVPTPTANDHAVNKAYADSLAPNILAGDGVTVTPGTGNVTIAADLATVASPMNGTAAPGTSTKVARQDHVHPSDTSRAPLASPAFSGTPTAPTAAAGTNNTQIATTAYVKSQNYLTANQTITVSGDATGSGTTTIALTLANSGVTAGTYPKVTVDAKGRVTGGAALAAGDIPTLTAAKISDFAAQVRLNRLDQMTAPTAAVSFGGQRITWLADPVDGADAATKAYVDSAMQGLDPKESVRAATTANIASLSGTMTIDGIALVAGNRVLVKNQTTASQNGIYVVQAGAWVRSTDGSTWDSLISAFVFVESGTVNADCGFLLTVDPGGTLGTTAVTVVQFAGAAEIVAGNGLTKTGNTLAVGAGTGITVGATTVGLTGQALALHNLATNGFFVRTAAGTIAARSIAVSGSGLSVANADGVAANPTISLSAALSSIGGLTPAADRIAYYTGVSAAALATLTAFGRSLIDDADASAARTTLGLGTMATQAANNVNITGGVIDGVTIDGGTF